MIGHDFLPIRKRLVENGSHSNMGQQPGEDQPTTPGEDGVLMPDLEGLRSTTCTPLSEQGEAKWPEKGCAR